MGLFHPRRLFLAPPRHAVGVINVEIDEQGASHEDDRERLEQFAMSMGIRPGIALRINPDNADEKFFRELWSASEE